MNPVSQDHCLNPNKVSRPTKTTMYPGKRMVSGCPFFLKMEAYPFVNGFRHLSPVVQSPITLNPGSVESLVVIYLRLKEDFSQDYGARKKKL